MPRPRRSQDTRAKLLDEGLNTLLRQGYNGTGIKEVLDAVRVPKGSFYNYFESKEHFGVEVLRHFALKVGERLRILREPGDGLAALQRFFEGEIAIYTKHPGGCLIGNLAAELGGSRQVPRQALAEAMHATRDAFAEVLTRTQQQGTVRNDLSAKELADFLFDAWEGSILRMKVEGSIEPLRRCVSFVLDEFFRPR